jgi:hypothetical protein
MADTEKNDKLREGYPEDANYDFAWPADYPYDADPHYPGGGLFAATKGQQMTLSRDQAQLWKELGMNSAPAPSGDQTPEQAINYAVDSFRWACSLEGLPMPDEAAVREYAPWGTERKRFDPNQLRDEEGQWTETGAGDGSAAIGEIDDALSGIPEARPEQPEDDFDEVFDHAEADQQPFRELLDLGKGLSQKLGGSALVEDDLDTFERKAGKLRAKPGKPVVVIPPLKKRESAREKLKRKRNYGPQKLADLNRASVLVDSLDEMPSMVQKAIEEAEAEGWTVHEPHNGFAGEGHDGYRDVAIALQSPTGHVTELQFHVNAMWRAKFSEGGHGLYQQIRGVDELPEAEQTPEVLLKREAWRTEMQRMYDAALAAA